MKMFEIRTNELPPTQLIETLKMENALIGNRLMNNGFKEYLGYQKDYREKQVNNIFIAELHREFLDGTYIQTDNLGGWVKID